MLLDYVVKIHFHEMFKYKIILFTNDNLYLPLQSFLGLKLFGSVDL